MNELQQMNSGPRPLWILWTCYRVCFCFWSAEGRGAVLWSLCGMVIRHRPLRSSLPMYLFPNGTDAGLRRTLLGSSETRDPWSGRLPVSGLLPAPFQICCRKTFWTQPGWMGISLPPTHHHHHLYQANHQQLLADHPGLVSNPCLHLP